MLDQNNTPLPSEGELKFPMQAMTQMMERMNFMMGNLCDTLDRVEKYGNEWYDPGKVKFRFWCKIYNYPVLRQ